MTNTTQQRGFKALLLSSVLAASPSHAQFDSGSTGELNALAPFVDTTIQLPEDGILNYTTVTIPADVTVRFERNAANTPVVILASGDVTIDGEIDISGGNATDVGPSGDGNLGDDGVPGRGGPGGFDGGAGGTVANPTGGYGLGPGGGRSGIITATVNEPTSQVGCDGAGASFVTNGSGGRCGNRAEVSQTPTGQAYGDPTLQPLIGGSGGGGGAVGGTFGGSGGGGGGGAILIASSGTLTVNGAIRANGGLAGDSDGFGAGGIGGEGSGGAIRLVASILSGEGTIEALDSNVQVSTSVARFVSVTSSQASDGRIRLEAENIERISGTTPTFTFSGPNPTFLANIPGVRISSVAGIATPASPTGVGDVIIPETMPNPVTIEFATTNVPVGNTIEFTLTPQSGLETTLVSGAITGTDLDGTASVSVDIPDGPSTLSASVTFTIAIASNGELTQDYSRFAKGNAVEKVRIDFDPVQGSMTTFIAKNGEEYSWPSNTIAFN